MNSLILLIKFYLHFRSVQVSSFHKVVALPMDILMKNKISQENVLRGTDSEDMRNVTFEIASRANSHLQKVIIAINTVHRT